MCHLPYTYKSGETSNNDDKGIIEKLRPLNAYRARKSEFDK